MIINNYNIRAPITKDIICIADIAKNSHKFALSRKEIESVIRRHNVFCIIAEEGDTILGFLMYKTLKQNYEIIDFGVRENNRLAGVGSALIDFLKINCNKSIPKKPIIAVVSDDNLNCHLFLKSKGFKGSVKKNYFAEENQDGYLMTYVPEA